MKNLIIFATFYILYFLPVNAQTDQGKIMAGGSSSFKLGLSKYSESTDNYLFIKMDPALLVFVVKNLGIGANLQMGYSSTGDRNDLSMSIGPIVRYYFGHSKIKPFISSSVNIGLSRTDYSGIIDFNSTTITNTYYTIAFSPGVAFFLNDKVSLDLQFLYSYKKNWIDSDNTYLEPGETSYNELYFSAGFSVFF